MLIIQSVRIHIIVTLARTSFPSPSDLQILRLSLSNLLALFMERLIICRQSVGSDHFVVVQSIQ